MTRAGSLQRYVQKDADTSDMAALTVPWRSEDFIVVPNWFIRTDAANDKENIFLAPHWSPSSIFSSTPICVRNVNYLSQFPDRLSAVSLVINLVVLMMLIETISRRQSLCAVVLCGMTPLSVVEGWI